MNIIGTGWRCCYWLVPTWYLAVTLGFLLLLLPAPPSLVKAVRVSPALVQQGSWDQQHSALLGTTFFTLYTV